MQRYIVIILALLFLTGCGSQSYYSAMFEDSSGFRLATAPDLEESEYSSQTNKQVFDRVEVVERKIVKRGNIRFETTDVNETKSLIAQTVQKLNGYISDDNVDDYSDRLEHRLTVRIPAENFDLFLNAVSESVTKFDYQKIEALDVTEEYIDLEARTKTKKELQNRYVALLERAETVEDILRIEREIGNLQTEIESVEGRMRYLKDRIAFSMLTVTYYQNIDTPASPFGFSSKFVEGIKNGWDGFLWFIIGLSHLWFFILLAVMFYYIRLWRKKKKVS